MYYFKSSSSPVYLTNLSSFKGGLFNQSLIIQGGSTALLCEGVGLRGPRVGLGLEGSRGGSTAAPLLPCAESARSPGVEGGVDEGGRGGGTAC